MISSYNNFIFSVHRPSEVLTSLPDVARRRLLVSATAHFVSEVVLRSEGKKDIAKKTGLFLSSLSFTNFFLDLHI